MIAYLRSCRGISRGKSRVPIRGYANRQQQCWLIVRGARQGDQKEEGGEEDDGHGSGEEEGTMMARLAPVAVRTAAIGINGPVTLTNIHEICSYRRPGRHGIANPCGA